MKRTAFWGRRFVSIVLIAVIAMGCGLLAGVNKDAAYAAGKDKANAAGKDSVRNTMVSGHAMGGAEETAPVPETGKSKMRLQASLPDEYDSRDHGFVTPVRNQDVFGVCWSFATIAAVESSLLAHDQGDYHRMQRLYRQGFRKVPHQS